MKVTIVGAGSVGSSCAEYIAIKDIANEIVLLDIKEGFAEGKSLDLMQTSSSLIFNALITGVTSDYEKTKSSDVVVITSGIPRKPGMTREELIGINAGIVDSVTENLLKYSPNAIIIVVSNPMEITGKPSSAEEEVQLLSEFMNRYQDEVDHITGKIS